MEKWGALQLTIINSENSVVKKDDRQHARWRTSIWNQLEPLPQSSNLYFLDGKEEGEGSTNEGRCQEISAK